MTMSLFIVCLNSLLSALEKKLTGIWIGQRGTKTTVIAYADDMTIIVSKLEEIRILQETLNTYGEAIGAKINTRKSRVVALGSWNTSIPITEYHISRK